MKVFKVLGIVLFIAGMVIVISYVFMRLWNFALVPAINVNPITWVQGIAIILIAKVLFGGHFGKGRGRWGSKGHHWSRKWKSMSDEEKEAMKARWKEKWSSKK